MPFSQETLNEKPYNACIRCAHIGITCDGPNFMAMTPERLSEWCRLRKEHLNALEHNKWSNAYIAETASLSKTSVDRFLSGRTDDGKMSTVAPILKTLVNGSWGQYPCAGYSNVNDMSGECERLRAELEKTSTDSQKTIRFLRDQIVFKEDQMKAKDRLLSERYDFLKRKDRVISVLSILLGVFVVLFILAITIDFMNPDRGFFWLQEVLNK